MYFICFVLSHMSIYNNKHIKNSSGPAAGLLPKHKEMCQSGHSDLIYTLTLGHSDWLPTGHSNCSIGKYPNP